MDKKQVSNGVGSAQHARKTAERGAFLRVFETISHEWTEAGHELAGMLCSEGGVGLLSEHVNFWFRPDPSVGTQF